MRVSGGAGEGSIAGLSRDWAVHVWQMEGRTVAYDPATSLLGDEHPENGPCPRMFIAALCFISPRETTQMPPSQ